MLNKGIINNFFSIIDIAKLGYMSFRIFLKTQHIDSKKEEKDLLAVLNELNLKMDALVLNQKTLEKRIGYLKGELLFSYPVVDEDDRGLVWTGDPPEPDIDTQPETDRENSSRV